MTRTQHITWCKERALEHVKNSDLKNAWASMCSDLTKHSETQEHPAIQLGMMLIMTGKLSTQPEMQKFIEGFN